MPLGGKPLGVRRSVQHDLHVLTDSESVMGPKASSDLVDVGVVRGCLAPCRFCRPSPVCPRGRDTTLPGRFPSLMVDHGVGA